MTNSNSVHITVSPRGQFYEARVGGELLTVARAPFCSAARVLLKRGHSPDAILTMSHAGKDVTALRAKLGSAAQLTVVENDRIGPVFAAYREPTWPQHTDMVGAERPTAEAEVHSQL